MQILLKSREISRSRSGPFSLAYTDPYTQVYGERTNLSLPIPVLRILNIEANRFYDRNYQMYEASLLTRCYTQHALRPFINAEINYQNPLNKGMDFIDLPSIFQDKSVISSIPDYFKNSESTMICYKYNKPIRHTIFNFNKLVSDLDIHANTPSS